MENGILLERESHRHVADFHVVGELRLELVAVVVGRAVLVGFHLVADQAVVAIPRHLIARHGRADPVDIDIVRTAFGDNEQCFLTGLRSRR